MTNNKQSSIDWLINEHFGGLENCTPDFRKKIKQAKGMCITEHENTWNNAINAVEKDKWDSFEDYYNETFENTK